jgi:hypothetical protein
LAPFEPREPSRPVGAVATRLPWVIAAVGLGAVIGGIGILFDWRDWVVALQRHALLEAEIAIAVGALPGYLLSQAKFPRRRDRRPTGLERTDASSVTVSPAPGYTHYLPCALLARDTGDARTAASSTPELRRDVVTGIMYVGPSGIRFQPGCVPVPDAASAAAAAADHAALSIDIGPVRMVSAHPVKLARRGLARVTTPVHYAMLMQWPGGRALFSVPWIGDTLPKLHDCLDNLRFGPRV